MNRDKLAELINFRIKEASNHSGSLNNGGMGGWIADKLCEIGFLLTPKIVYGVINKYPYNIVTLSVERVQNKKEGCYLDCYDTNNYKVEYHGFIEDFEKNGMQIFFTKEQANARVLELKFGWGK